MYDVRIEGSGSENEIYLAVPFFSVDYNYASVRAVNSFGASEAKIISTGL